MATASTSSSSVSPEEKTNGFKLMRLIIDLGTEALRNEFKNLHPGNLHSVLSSHKSKLRHLKTKNVITQPQWDKLYPSGTSISNIKEFDITLLVILLRNICGISAPIGTGWNKMPVNTDSSLGANIVRVKLFRNEFFGHIPETGVSATHFEARWKEVSATLIHFGISQTDIDKLKDEECGEEEVDRIRREWTENDTRVALQLLGLKKMRTEDRELLLDIQSDVKSIKSEKSSSNEINVSKYLASCNFDSDIELLNQKWCKGTREWVFDEVSTWFNDTTSDSRAFIITGQAGMGKSVIAAVICKRFAEQLAACHFCQYNNDRYDNPKILLQSLAAQLSNVIPEYRKALIEKLSGKEGKRLDDMNIQALYSLLFKEPLTGIEVAEKYLIVIDAVDESRLEGRSDLVDLIANYLCQLPSFIRFLITSRPENAIDKKLNKLKPMVLSRSNQQNVKDIHVFFEDKLSGLEQENHITKLVEKSDGLMLVADCLYQFLQDSCSQFNVHDLPTGIEEIYESHFRRLKKAIELFQVSEDNFLSFLSVVTVAREPLPIALIERVFRSDDDPRLMSRSKLNKIKNCLTLVLVINEDRITFLHKSVKDWLVESDHEFTADEKRGHETLANICAREMDEVKGSGIKPPFNPASQYALLYGIQHKMAGTQDTSLKPFIDNYVTDLEIMYACVIIDVYALFNNIVSLKNYIVSGSLLEETRNSVETLILLIRKYIGALKDFPHSFLQHVLNWGGDEHSLKAATLLKSRYKEQVYFELAEKDDFDDSLVGRIYLSGALVGFDISSSEDHLICEYEDGKIELFSLVDFRSLWTIQVFVLKYRPGFSEKILSRRIVFDPRKNVILPARLDYVINLRGTAEPGPFLCEEIDSLFNNCCFSNDQSKMATTRNNLLTVWSLENNEKLRSFSASKFLKAVMFSANSRFLATSDTDDEFVVYDLEKDFLSESKVFDYDYELNILSTFEADSWILTCDIGMCIVKSNLSEVQVCQSHDGVHVIQYFPSNIKAVAEFEAALKNNKNGWLDEFIDIQFACLDNGIAIVSELLSRVLRFFRISNLKETPSMSNNPLAGKAIVDISLDGKFIYASKRYKSLSIYEVDCNLSILSRRSYRKWPDIPFCPVTNGVFFCGKLDKRSKKKWLGSWKSPKRKPRYLTDTPELWNSDLTERLDTFPELSGTFRCQAISREIVACVMDGKVFFFDVVKRKVVSDTRVPQNLRVIACSSTYHVLMDHPSSSASLWRAGDVVAELKDLSNEQGRLDGRSGFSPSSKTLALRFEHHNHLLIFNVSPAKLRLKLDFEFFINENPLVFLDEDHLLCKAYDTSMCIINVTTGNALTSIDCGSKSSWGISRTLENSSVFLCVNSDEKTKLFKVWLPR